ncbi:PD-(D/E)XK nuclease family protein [Natronorubrum daqingense]|uniref:PD-(D/E)XK endonuclease-like domain-containing protein n=1 Tax=Natronorubrum daqingense TaxID=588898 RepID=A0A1N7CPW1_9EURY|nr:PD-(D/E)XK nuclease family protein [Natronorubrum daqingense]APX97004.1 hypothetical protein BB347_10440 [Natronorubrum daqingense]SIR65636.1 hypothetical protein SAMN05421809_1819 [Natronorubrum daqingense]
MSDSPDTPTPTQTGSTASIERLHVDGLTTSVRCPRKYELAHEHDLESTSDETAAEDRVDLLGGALCAALRTGDTDPDRLLDAATTALEERWNDHDERFHSREQRRHVRRVLDATLEAYVDRIGVEHAKGIDRLTSETNGEVIGPTLPLSSRVSLPESEAGDASVTLESTVDYLTADGRSVVGVRFVPTLAPLGRLRYRPEWEGDIEAQFHDHFDPEADVFEPGFVGSLFETAAVVDGLRTRCQQLGLENRTCRYVQIPVADRSQTTVNWVQESVDASLEVHDLTDRYIDHHTYGMTHEHRNRAVDDRLAAAVARIVDRKFEPETRWESISSASCPECGYSVCCQEYLASEVRFDG